MNYLQTMRTKTLNLNCYLMAAETKAVYNSSSISHIMPVLSTYISEASKKAARPAARAI